MECSNDKRKGKNKSTVVFRGAPLGPREQRRIRSFVAARPRATRNELARGVCKLFGWQRPNGEPPIRSCTTLLDRLERMGVLQLPAARRRCANRPSRKPDLASQLVFAPEEGTVSLDTSAPLVVRPIFEAERLGWQAYMQKFHYLGDCRLVGESLRYVAILGDELVALIGWGSASLSNKARDSYIGWDKASKARGLHLVINNIRYLIFPWVQEPNLASRILAANLRRLSNDWQQSYSHPVLLAETFVDTSRFAGTCYRASNWRYVGDTLGFRKRGLHYSFHGQSKAVFVYPLHRRSNELLCAPAPSALPTTQLMEDTVRTIQWDDLPFEGEDGLFAVLGTITDTRKRRGKRHQLQSVLTVALCATLAGARNFGAIYEWAVDQSKELLTRIRCRRSIPPSERTIRRVLQSVDVEEIDAKMGQWIAGLSSLQGCALALDGKTLRGSGEGEDGKAVHLLSAVVHGGGEVVAQTRVDTKTNEITRVAPLLEELDISGSVVTTDALLTQREIARHLVEDKHADYVFTVKNNQPTLRKDISDLFVEEEKEALRRKPAGKKPPETEAFPPSARDD